MQIEYRTGDLIDGPEHLIVHGCNAEGVMGRGLALAIKQRLPFAFRTYREVYLTRGLSLGEVIFAIDVGSTSPSGQPERPRIVANAITQETAGSDGRQYVDYDAIASVIRKVDSLVALTHNDIDIAGIGRIDAVGFPKIGAGLGGGDWQEIAEIIEAESQHFHPIIYQL